MASYMSFQTEGHAKLYEQFRPKYSDKIFNTVVGYLNEKHHGPYSLAVDVGCGNGQSTLPLAPYFQQVIGLDISEAQITQAKKQHTKNVCYRVGSASSIPLSDCSTDLVTVGTAAHWFASIEDFYEEVNRILKPGGCLAMYAYLPSYPNKDLCHTVFREWFQTLAHYKAECLHKLHVDRYKGFELPFADKVRHDCDMVLYMSIAQYSGYLRSLSYVQKYQENNPNQPDYTQTITSTFHDILDPNHNNTDEELFLHIVFDIIILLGRKTV